MGISDEDDWGNTNGQSNEFVRMETIDGHLLIAFPVGYIAHSPTKFTQPGKQSDVIVVDIVDLDAPDENGAPGKLYRTQWWRGAFLVRDLRPKIGSKVLARIGRGVSRNGMNPPWVLTDMTGDPATLDRARQWVRANPAFQVSEFTPPAPQSEAAPAPAAPPRFPVQPNQGYPSQGYQQDPYRQAPPSGYSQLQQQSYPQPNNQYWQQAPQQQAPQQQMAPAPAAVPAGPSAEEMDMLNRMRQLRQQQDTTYPQQGYPTDPPF